MGAIYYNGIWYTQGKEGQIHAGFTPIGTIIAVMGKTAPMNYLACDGQIVNIADYPELATYFMTQFEASNYFGGNGVTTFAVPDLRGEFLRGTGTNSHTDQGDGSDVGEHQDATKHLYVNAHYESSGTYFSSQRVSSLRTYPANSDHVFNDTSTHSYVKATVSSTSYAPFYSSRPTNTSVLYCVATKNIYMDPGCNYSTEEQVVGTWIDGKPIYQRTFQIAAVNISSGSTLSIPNKLDNTPFEMILSIIGTRTTPNYGQVYMGSVVKDASLYLYPADTFNSISALTIRYTKTTDIVDI